MLLVFSCSRNAQVTLVEKLQLKYIQFSKVQLFTIFLESLWVLTRQQVPEQALVDSVYKFVFIINFLGLRRKKNVAQFVYLLAN